jgi:hypothetical protein
VSPYLRVLAIASCQYARLADSRSECKVAMWSEATRNIVRGDMGAGSLAASTLGSSLAFATLAALGGAGVGGGVGGSSMMRVLSLGFLGAFSLAPAGLPRLLGSGIASSAGACSAIGLVFRHLFTLFGIVGHSFYTKEKAFVVLLDCYSHTPVGKAGQQIVASVAHLKV